MDCKHNSSCCKTDMGRGCDFCGCGQEMMAEMKEGCFKLHSTDWLEGMPENFPDNIYEIRFKNTRRSYYRNVNNLPLKRGDIVAVEASPGHDIGIVSLTGDMVARQMKRVGFTPLNGEFRKIYRKAKPFDIEKWQEAIGLEHETMIRSRQIAADMGLNMKIGDVEYQGDKIKAIFYYIADERVDFRELIKVFADQFRIRIEMKQIGARQEAGRIGGIGSCGRQLCCASWISSFVSVTTNAARTQEISLNPQKLAGQCSKLKCCMIYELDTYIDARKDFPRLNQPLQALDGDYYLVKTDILGRTMSFSTSPNAMAGMITLPIDRVWEIVKQNRKGIKVDKIVDERYISRQETEPGFVNVIGEESIMRFDKVKSDRRNGNRKRPRRRDEGAEEAEREPRPNGNRGQQTRNEENKAIPDSGSDRPRGTRPNRGPRSEGQTGNSRNSPASKQTGAGSENRNGNGQPQGEGNRRGGNSRNGNRKNGRGGSVPRENKPKE